MQKVYTVLKNNQQQGPFTLQELQELELKPTDLIWVEGRSAAWSYPSEIKELQQFNGNANGTVANTAQKAQTWNNSTGAQKNERKVFVSLPGNEARKMSTTEEAPVTNLEAKAEALRQKVLAHQATTASAPTEAIAEVRLKRSLDEVAGDFANWAIRDKEKRNFKKHKSKAVAIAAILIVAVTTGYLLYSKTDEKVIVTDNAAQTVQEKAMDGESLPDIALQSEPADLHPETIPPTKTAITSAKQEVSTKKTEIQPAIVQKTELTLPVVTETVDPTAGTEEEATAMQQEPEKKKTLGESIDGFFDKFKNKNKEASNGTPTNKSEERKSAKRGEGEASFETVDVSSQVKVTSSLPNNNWMLGIKGQKLTLQNNSKATIQSAWVTVTYYSEDETLLDTKRIEFKNIKPAQKSTLPLPDHRMASYTTQQVTAATGIVAAN